MGICRIIIPVDFTRVVIFPKVGTGVSNPDLYSVCENGCIVYIYKDSNDKTPALGNQVMIKDNNTGNFYRYCHLLYGSISVNVGDNVNLSTKIGKMGNTGNSTGTHLHLELTKTENWDCSNFLNPVEPLGIPNVRGTIIEYVEAENPPIPPNPKHSNKWIKFNNFKLNVKY